MHAAVNYPLESWGTFFPLSPTKIFYDSRMNGSGNAAYIYPNGPTTIVSKLNCDSTHMTHKNINQIIWVNYFKLN